MSVLGKIMRCDNDPQFLWQYCHNEFMEEYNKLHQSHASTFEGQLKNYKTRSYGVTYLAENNWAIWRKLTSLHERIKQNNQEISLFLESQKSSTILDQATLTQIQSYLATSEQLKELTEFTNMLLSTITPDQQVKELIDRWETYPSKIQEIWDVLQNALKTLPEELDQNSKYEFILNALSEYLYAKHKLITAKEALLNLMFLENEMKKTIARITHQLQSPSQTALLNREYEKFLEFFNDKKPLIANLIHAIMFNPKFKKFNPPIEPLNITRPPRTLTTNLTVVVPCGIKAPKTPEKIY
jgi:hypothetical protein